MRHSLRTGRERFHRQRPRKPAKFVATVKEQPSQIQKVSAQLEASKPAPQVVNKSLGPALELGLGLSD